MHPRGRPRGVARRLAESIRRNAIAYAALLVALGGTSYAAMRLPADSVGTRQLMPRSVGNGQLKNEAVTDAKVRAGSLTGRVFAPGTLPAVPALTITTARGSVGYSCGSQGCLPRPAGSTGSAVAFCPPGYTVVGGGFDYDPTLPENVIASAPQGSHAWSATFALTAEAQGPFGNAYAVCAST